MPRIFCSRQHKLKRLAIQCPNLGWRRAHNCRCPWRIVHHCELPEHAARTIFTHLSLWLIATLHKCVECTRIHYVEKVTIFALRDQPLSFLDCLRFHCIYDIEDRRVCKVAEQNLHLIVRSYQLLEARCDVFWLRIRWSYPILHPLLRKSLRANTLTAVFVFHLVNLLLFCCIILRLRDFFANKVCILGILVEFLDEYILDWSQDQVEIVSADRQHRAATASSTHSCPSSGRFKQ
mmetsp:Transcript_79644/g.124214  ORF Transcript_79644/g.124214 Transcript_79644/m.124214 type:complete len:235 (-) Transcript_79644:1281-1985(-)